MFVAMNHRELAEWRRGRVELLAQKMGGNVALGKALGHSSGEVIAHLVAGRRPVSVKTIEAIEALPGRANWFTVRDVVIDDEPFTIHECLQFLQARLRKLDPSQVRPAQIALRHFIDTLGDVEDVALTLEWLARQGASLNREGV